MNNKVAKEFWFDHRIEGIPLFLADAIWERMSEERRKEELEQIKEIYEGK